MPVLLAICIEEYGENVVLYYQNKELEINGETISRIIDEPSKYFIHVEKGTSKKINFVSSLFKIFKIEETENYRNNINLLTNEMKKWVLSLPKIARDVTSTNSIIFNESFITVKNDLLKPDMNNNEFLFQKIGDSFGTDDYEHLQNEVYSFKKIYDNYVDDYTNNLVYDFKERFEHNSNSNLNSLLNTWHKNIEPQVKNTILGLETKKLFEYTSHIDTYNYKEIMENISNIIVGRYIEDWQEDTYDEFFENLDNILTEIKNIETSDLEGQEKILISDGTEAIEKYVTTSEISLLGNTLKNNIEDSIEEYGDSISESEKIMILLQIIKKYM